MQTAIEGGLHPSDVYEAAQFQEYLRITTLILSRSDLDAIKAMQLKPRRDWEVAFTVDTKGGIFPFTRWGKTPTDERSECRGIIPALDNIADISMETRGESGRIFIRENGAYYKDRSGTPQQFVAFKLQQQS